MSFLALCFICPTDQHWIHHDGSTSLSLSSLVFPLFVIHLLFHYKTHIYHSTSDGIFLWKLRNLPKFNWQSLYDSIALYSQFFSRACYIAFSRVNHKCLQGRESVTASSCWCSEVSKTEHKDILCFKSENDDSSCFSLLMNGQTSVNHDAVGRGNLPWTPCVLWVLAG